jgi:hypothetical protein
MSKTNIILACENEDAQGLIENVTNTLNEKLAGAIQLKQKKVHNNLFESTESKKSDPYESYKPEIREAIDYVVESVLESGLELENTILMASKQYKVDDKELKEYFDTFLETTKTEVSVDSTRSDDGDDKRGMRDDEDTNKRVRYESVIHLDDGGQIMLSEEYLDTNVKPVFENLNESNKAIFLQMLTKDKSSFLKVMEFCQKVQKG